MKLSKLDICNFERKFIYFVQKNIQLFLFIIITVFALLMRNNPCSCMVPYGQAAHSPDHARPLTFKSQFFHVCFNTNRAFKMIFGDLRSNSLAGEDTSENRSNLLSVLAWSPDHARQLTFRSQTFFITIRLIIMPWTATNSLRVSMCILSHSR